MTQTTRRLCLCEERCTDRDEGRFTYSALRLGWIFTNGPKRTMSTKARYHASVRPFYQDHAGEPYVWECCPYCGGDLPMTTPHWTDDSEGAE